MQKDVIYCENINIKFSQTKLPNIKAKKSFFTNSQQTTTDTKIYKFKENLWKFPSTKIPLRLFW